MDTRPTHQTDLKAVQTLVEAAFIETEADSIKALVGGLISEHTSPPVRSLVIEINDQIIGYIACSPVFPRVAPGMSGYILAPLAVSPEHQGRGVGSTLIRASIEMLSNAAVDVLLVYGNPAYYGRFGFHSGIAHAFHPPYPLAYPSAWQGLQLTAAALPDSPVRFDCLPSLDKPALW